MLQCFVIVLSTLTASLGTVRAQYSVDIMNNKKASDLYNETGYLTSKSISVDGNVTVSHGSGSPNYIYPLSDYSVAGVPIKTTLNYCASVGFTNYKDYYAGSKPGEWGTALAGYGAWSKFHQNRPAWIIGVNGFAMQVLSMTNQYVMNPATYGPVNNQNTRETYTDNGSTTNDFVWTINGYDVCNRMEDLTNNIQPYIDKISILRADGSILELRNFRMDMYGHVWDQPLNYTGRYFNSSDVNSTSYGIVEYDTTDWGNSLLATMINPIGFHKKSLPRKLRYYPGDGLEYVFYEYTAPYGCNVYFDGFHKTAYGGITAGPTIFYLDKINNADRELASFEYSRHKSYNRNDFTKGRATFLGFEGHTFNYNDAFMTVEALGRSTKVFYETIPLRSGDLYADQMKDTIIGSDTIYYTDEIPVSELGNKSYLTQVTRIQDPLNRQTTFGYESYTKKYTGFKFPHSYATTIELTNKRCTSVTEPDAKYTLEYYTPTTNVIVAGNNGNPYAQNSVVKKLKKYDKSNTLLSTEEYVLTYPNYSARALTSSVTTTDNITNKSKQLNNTYEHNSYYGYGSYLDVTPSATQIKKSEETYYGVSTGKTTETAYSPLNGGLQWVPTYKKVSITENGTTRVQSQESIRYATIKLAQPYPNEYRDTTYDVLILADTTKSYRPDVTPDNSSLLGSTVNTYTNLQTIDSTYTKYFLQWDKFASIRNFIQYDSLRRVNGLPIVRWEDAPDFIHVFKRDSVLQRDIIPPLYKLLTQSIQYDAQGNIISGTKIERQTLFGSDYFARGAVKFDSIIGSGGIVIPGKQYTYSGLYTRLPETVRNANGSVTFQSSFFGHWDSERTGLVKHNDNSTKLDTLKGTLFSQYYEQPETIGQLVRRHKMSVSGIDTGVIQQKLSYTYYGLPQSTVDANGWYSRYKYDANGRITTIWLPYDFQGNTMWSDRRRFTGTKEITSFGYTESRFYQDTCNGNRDGRTSPSIEFDHQSMYASIIPTVVPEYCVPASKAYLKDNDKTIQQTINGTVYRREQECNGIVESELPPAYSLSSASFRLYVADILGECVNVQITFPGLKKAGTQIDTTCYYVFNCNGGGVPIDAAKEDEDSNEEIFASGPGGNESNENQIMTTPNALLTINLDRYLTQLKAGGRFSAKVVVTSSGTRVDFANNSDDLRPRFILTGDFRDTTEYSLADYTVGYEHDYNGIHGSVITTKVDDSLHTVNSVWNLNPLTYSHKSISSHALDANDKVKKTYSLIKLPGGISRTDSVTISNTGLGVAYQVTDQEGQIIQTYKDVAGRDSVIINADATTVKKEYYLGSETTFNITDQNFYSFVSVAVTINETGDTTTQYTDNFGRVRRERVKPTTTTELITRYEYNTRGQLTHVINPAGDTT